MPRPIPPIVVPLACCLLGFCAGYAAFRTALQTGSTSPASLHRAATSDAAAEPRAEDATALASSRDRISALFAAAEQTDPLRRDHELWRALQQMQSSDFLALLSDLPAPVKRFEKLPDEVRWRVIEPAMDRWLGVDTPGALRWLDTMFRSDALLPGTPEKRTWTMEANGLNGDLLKVLARRQPEWLLERLGLLKGEQKNLAVFQLLDEASQRDFSQARQWLERFPDGSERKAAARGFTTGLARVNPEAAFDFALTEQEAVQRAELWDPLESTCRHASLSIL